jgi:3-isopropylmalate/(R)-2-methylmalate dehydratase small subunit
VRREPVIRFEGPAVALSRDDVDTDQIIPARFLKTTSRAGLGAHLFADWRRDADGRPRPEFILNAPAAAGARILVAGRNFGCGSSREHAPWALADFGFRAVVAASFADIFRQNALKNGLLPIVLPEAVHAGLLALVGREPGLVMSVDLARQVVGLPRSTRGVVRQAHHAPIDAEGRTESRDDEAAFTIDAFARECLLKGVDEIGYVLAQEDAIARFEASPASSRW